MPSVTVKGKEKPVRIFAVINHISVASGPKTLAEVRELLGIAPPDFSAADVNSEEKKYKIGEE
jgi:adenylate cyclase